MDFGITPAAGGNVRCALKAKTAGANQDIIVRMQATVFGNNSNGAGLVLRESGTGKLITWGIHNNGIQSARWTNETTFNTTISGLILAGGGIEYQWLRIGLVADDPKKFYISRNGLNWILLADATQTGFMTFDQVGFFQYHDTGIVVTGTNRLSSSILYYADAGIVP